MNKKLPNIVNDNIWNPQPSDDLNKSGILSTGANYAEKEDLLVPISIKPNELNNNFMVLEGIIIDDIVEHPQSVVKKPIIVQKQSCEKMDMASTFYIGSLTVLGLFVFFRLIQKSR
uniref:Uncharacterized protein n=1 Tax=viral metagenome TaxID=1070528 RepID=A0A6C0JDP3_9ZZZZ